MRKSICGVVVGGGNGTRLVPLSSPENPKQFIRGLCRDSELSCAELAVQRLQKLTEAVLFVGNVAHKQHIASMKSERPFKYVLEERLKGTTWALHAAATWFSLDDYDLMISVPADQWVSDSFIQEIQKALTAKDLKEKVALFGINQEKVCHSEGPSQYGWIKPGKEIQFKEKPEEIPGPDWLVNSGIICINPSFYLSLVKKYVKRTEEGPVDKLLIERIVGTDLLKVFKLNCEWSDLGTWDSLVTHYASKETVEKKFGVNIDGLNTAN